VLEDLYFSIELPKLHVMTIHKLLGFLFRGFVIITEDVNGPHEVAVVTNNVRPILGHHVCSRASTPYVKTNAATSKIELENVGFTEAAVARRTDPFVNVGCSVCPPGSFE
jgi:hypothetical protein